MENRKTLKIHKVIVDRLLKNFMMHMLIKMPKAFNIKMIRE